MDEIIASPQVSLLELVRLEGGQAQRLPAPELRTNAMEIQENDVRQLTNEIWGGMLQIELAPGETAKCGPRGIGACVQITGAWEGAVRVDCSLQLARLATARFMAVEPEQVEIEQIRDAMGGTSEYERRQCEAASATTMSFVVTVCGGWRRLYADGPHVQVILVAR